jgi:hypothetical protein
MSELITTALGAGLGLVSGVVLALVGSRKRLETEYDIALRKYRIEAYQELWRILEPLAYFSPPSAVTYAVATNLSRALRSWYFEVGGLFLSERTREAYFDLQKGLGGVIKGVPEDHYEPLDPRRFERLRSIASNLRTASTQDVATRVKSRLKAPLAASMLRRLGRSRAVQVTVRRGWLWGADEQECCSVLVQNPLHGPAVLVEDVYFDTAKRLSVLKEPIRLGPGSHWEVAVPARSIPATGEVWRLVRVELSDGRVVKPRRESDIEPHPEFVYVSGQHRWYT